jgi:hypothetical protein
MADNVGYTPGTGATVAADDIGGVLYQRVKLATGADGTATDVGPSSGLPVEVVTNGEMAEQLEAIRLLLATLTGSIGRVYPDASNRMRVIFDAAPAVTVTGSVSITSGTVTTVSTVSAITDFNGTRADLPARSLSALTADSLRRNITVT